MRNRKTFIVASLGSAAAINVALAACTAATTSSKEQGHDAGVLDVVIEAVLGPKDAKADVVLPVTGQLELAVEDCNKESPMGTGYSTYYAEHKFTGYSADEIVSRLRVVVESPSGGALPDYPAVGYGAGRFQVKADGTVGAHCEEGLSGMPSAKKARFILQK